MFPSGFYRRQLLLPGLILLATGPVRGQMQRDREGFQWGSVVIHPEVSIRAAYDDRTLWSPGNALDDFYTEAAAGVRLENLPALFRITGNARYGYRYYSQYTTLDDDFYSAGASVSTTDSPLLLEISTALDKSLDYDARYDPDTGEGPGSILTDRRRERLVSRGRVGYAYGVAEALAIVPTYALEHYYETFEPSGSAEWQIHEASLQLRRQQTEYTQLSVAGSYGVQVNDDENGTIATLSAGISSRISEKTRWNLTLGYGVADYEISGTDQGFVGDLRINWQTTERMSLYAFGGSDFQPGYNGGAARKVYRAGYGANWQPLDRWVFGASMLHDYEEDVGNSSSSSSRVTGQVRNFFNAQTTHIFTPRVSMTLSGTYNDDQRDPSQTVISLRATYSF